MAVVSVGDRTLEHVAGVGAGGGEVAPLGLGLGAHQQQLTLRRGVGAMEIEGAAGMASGGLEAPGAQGGRGRFEQRGHGMAPDGRLHTVDAAELAEQLGRRRGVVGDLVDRCAALGHHGGDTGMSLRAHSLGQRLVGDLTDDGAAEAPPVTLDVDQAVGGQLVEVAAPELLTELLGEALE